MEFEFCKEDFEPLRKIFHDDIFIIDYRVSQRLDFRTYSQIMGNLLSPIRNQSRTIRIAIYEQIKE